MVARRVLIITALFGPPFGTAASLSAVIDELAITGEPILVTRQGEET